MKHARHSIWLACLALLVVLTGPWVCAQDKIDMKLLYAGHPGSDREKDFVGFLEKHFVHVETCDLKGFKQSQSKGFAVTLMDYDGDGFKAPRPSVRREYEGSLMTVGVIGAFICGNLQLKTGYL
ncbi:MAG: hypothetical protein HQ515_07480 [Phycisphaeraceae bacterium]|nr:hypothetical protein [Phycisphaeraceae bacterium]